VRTLVVGGGGREHAIVRHLLANSPSAEVIAAPGNPGIAADCPVFEVPATDAGRLASLAREQNTETAIVGPEAALSVGVADALRAAGVAVLGTGADGSRLESSKSWAKELMNEAGIPTAAAKKFRDSARALRYLEGTSLPVVVKADGLAAGKGAIVCSSRAEAARAVTAMLDDAAFGDSGSTVLIEDFLVGQEYSMMVFTDGNTLSPMPLSQDHKPIGDGDTGPNTGGMGAYAPVPGLAGAAGASLDRVFYPLLAALGQRGIDYRGVITGNLMWTADGPRVIEFNARFGDPEAEVTLPLLRGDLAEIARHVDQRTLSRCDVRWKDEWAVCVVMAAAGYPGAVRTGDAITGLEATVPGATVLHAGTAVRGDQVVTAGGRVVIPTATGTSFAEARQRAYAAVRSIHFDGSYYRSDIGWRAQASLQAAADASVPA
jgi:phosphoribosylamine--glycine ligase